MIPLRFPYFFFVNAILFTTWNTLLTATLLLLYLHYWNMLGVLQYVTKRLREITKLLTLQYHYFYCNITNMYIPLRHAHTKYILCLFTDKLIQKKRQTSELLVLFLPADLACSFNNPKQFVMLKMQLIFSLSERLLYFCRKLFSFQCH